MCFDATRCLTNYLHSYRDNIFKQRTLTKSGLSAILGSVFAQIFVHMISLTYLMRPGSTAPFPPQFPNKETGPRLPVGNFFNSEEKLFEVPHIAINILCPLPLNSIPANYLPKVFSSTTKDDLRSFFICFTLYKIILLAAIFNLF